MKRYILSLFFFLGGLSLNAQSLDVGVGIGGVVYWGDLNTDDFGTNIGNTNIALQLTANYLLTDYVSIRGGLLYGNLSGDDSKSTQPWQRERNLDFTSPLVELSLLSEIHVFGDNRLDGDLPFSPFVALGLSGFYFNPSTILDGQSYDLQPLGTEGQGLPGFADKYSRISGSLLFGGGVKIRVTQGITLVVDGLARRTFTDYIDDLSGDYVSYNELLAGNGETAARLGNRMAEYLGQAEPVILPTGTQRGGVQVQDYYFSGMATFYINLTTGRGFGRRGVDTSKCPTF